MMNKSCPILLLLLSLFFTVVASAQSNYGEEQLTNTIEKLEAAEATPQNQQKLERYKQALADLKLDNNARKAAQHFQNVMDRYPVLSHQLKTKIANYRAPQFTSPKTWSLQKIDQEIAQQRSLQTTLKQRQQDLGNELTTIGVRVSNFQHDIEILRQKLNAVQKKQDKDIQESPLSELNEAQRIALQIKESALSTQIQMIELEQLSASNRSELAQLNNKVTQLRLNDINAYLSELTTQRNAILRRETEETIAQSQRVNASSDFNSPFLLEQLNLNQKLSAQLTKITGQNETVQNDQLIVGQQIDTLTTTLVNFKEQVEWLKISSAFGENLRAQVGHLPNEPPMEKLEEQIVESRLARFKYQQSLNQLDDIKPATPLLNEAELASLNRLLEARRLLLTQLISTLDNNIYEQAKLKVSYSKLSNILKQIKQQADEHLFWVPNTQLLNANSMKELLSSIIWLTAIDNGIQIPQALLSIPVTLLSLAIIAIIALTYIRYPLNRFFNKHIDYTFDKVGKVTQDKFAFTLINLTYSVLDALIFPMILLIFSELLISAWEYAFAVNLGHALKDSLFLLFLYLLFKNLIRKKGLFHIHLGLNKERTAKVWNHYRLLFFISWPMYLIQTLCHQYPDQPFENTLGRFAFIILCGALIQFYYRLYQLKLPLSYKEKTNGKPHIFHHTVWALLILAPFISAIMAVMGYLSTAQVLLRQMEASLLTGVFFLLTYYLIRRGMLLQKRRLAFERAKAKRIEILAQRAKERESDESNTPPESPFDTIEEPEIDLDQISSQSLGLIRTLLMLLFVALNALFWSEIQSAFVFLDTVTLWDVSSTLNGVDQIAAITLKNFLLAIFTVILTTVLVRNLAGALELLILQHLDLTPGTGFAITTITKYLTTAIGIVVSFNFLGVDWAKTQWLVAALTVGLGFGLQEIFANFVSGLIILFEKPIRIGDTVTIRDLTGNISKIQTRATTIVDWDRKEIIVPNKAFITEQFVNWSLSDSITRVKICIGVNLNSDIETVTKILKESAESMALTLDNPAPEVFFVGYRENALQFEVRCYVAEMGHRMSTAHEVYTLINKKFKECNIHIAYPQLDLHVKEDTSSKCEVKAKHP